MKITKAIIPAAGLGTRLLPLSKAIPKEMMPLLDKPALQYILEEGSAAGITSFYVIMNDDKKMFVERYFAKNPALDAHLAKTNKNNTLYTMPSNTSLTFIPQPHPLGLGHAVFMAYPMMQPDEYCAVLLPDDIIEGKTSCIQRMITIAQTYNATVIAVEKVSPEKVSSYGIIAPKNILAENIIEIANVVEKPSKEYAPSHFGIIGRYILPYHIFQAIQSIADQARGEIQLTDAIAYLLEQGERVLAYTIQGNRYDIGSLSGLFEATLSLGLKKEPYTSLIKKTLHSTHYCQIVHDSATLGIEEPSQGLL